MKKLLVVGIFILKVLSVQIDFSSAQTCIKQNCHNQWTACQRDPRCQQALKDCEQRCGNRGSCIDLCLSGKGDPAAISVAKCAEQHRCFTNQYQTQKQKSVIYQ